VNKNVNKYQYYGNYRDIGPLKAWPMLKGIKCLLSKGLLLCGLYMNALLGQRHLHVMLDGTMSIILVTDITTNRTVYRASDKLHRIEDCAQGPTQ